MDLSEIKLRFSQGRGVIETPLGVFVAIAWAGNGLGKNNPSMQEEHNVGPLPRGLYRVGPWGCGNPESPDYVEGYPRSLGPMIARLTQVEGETFGRAGFFFHGPASDPAKYGQESRGCTVVPWAGREIVKSFAPEGSVVQVTA